MRYSFRLAIIFLILPCLPVTAFAQGQQHASVETILRNSDDPLIKKVLADPSGYRLQIIYTRIDRNRNNRPRFTNASYGDTTAYFNPASMVKLPLAILALEKLNRLNRRGVNKYTHIRFDSSYPAQVAADRDTTAASGKPSIAHYIKKAFLISDNDAYNRLYQFLGQRWIDSVLKKKGYAGTRIIRQFMGFPEEQNRHTNQVDFFDEAGRHIYRQQPAYNSDSFFFPGTVKVGTGYINRNGQLINEPFDFTRQNNVSLEHLRLMLQALIFPASVKKTQRFHLTEEDRHFLLQFLSQYPSETNDPKYDTGVFYDSYVKFFFRDSTRLMPAGVRVFNKVGWAYGFLTDVAYVGDFNNRVEYMLAATLYVNSDSILNDSRYDYDTIGYPFLRAIGKTIYQYELQRKRRHKPDLSMVRLHYERRDPNDKRRQIREVDN
jgi:hypothetical protein